MEHSRRNLAMRIVDLGNTQINLVFMKENKKHLNQLDKQVITQSRNQINQFEISAMSSTESNKSSFVMLVDLPKAGRRS